ncbi:MAG: acyl-CoA thioesterase, partial [Saprospiraceae bacterium]|nr:acyl-CoA thioesterase [Saprospiraceae bacterium]
TDQMGYLYYGNYAQYYEIGRVEMIRSLGVSYKQLEEELGIMMPVMSMEVRYLRPLFYDNMVTIKTTLKEFPGDEIVFHVELYNEAGKIANGGKVKLCFVDIQSKKRVPTPEILLEKLRPYFEVS